MIISYDLEIATTVPLNKCECGSVDFTDHDEHGLELGGNMIMCVECKSFFDRYDHRIKVDWQEYAPLGVSCAIATYLKDNEFSNKFWTSGPDASAMTQAEVEEMVGELLEWQRSGHTIVGWNSLMFDLHLLAEEHGLVKEASELALNHADLMFYVFARKGWRLGLDTALTGAGLQSKQHEVTLSDGTVLTDMSGAMAPALWQAGEREAVLTYLKGDGEQTCELANVVYRRQLIQWTSGSGRNQTVRFSLVDGKLPSVKDCLSWPVPNTDWMKKGGNVVLEREDYIDWLDSQLLHGGAK